MPDLDAGTGYWETNIRGRLFHPEYSRGFRFGAMSLRPAMVVGELGDVLRLFVADATGEGLDG